MASAHTADGSAADRAARRPAAACGAGCAVWRAGRARTRNGAASAPRQYAPARAWRRAAARPALSAAALSAAHGGPGARLPDGRAAARLADSATALYLPG